MASETPTGKAYKVAEILTLALRRKIWTKNTDSGGTDIWQVATEVLEVTKIMQRNRVIWEEK